MDKQSLVTKILRDNKYSVTKARLLVFRLLVSAAGPQSISQLIRSSKETVDRVSVYRTIELYEKLGIVQRINIGWKYKLELSDIFLEHHHHISCINCGRVFAIEEEAGVEKLIEKLGESSGFILTSHQLELQGYCSKCQQ